MIFTCLLCFGCLQGCSTFSYQRSQAKALDKYLIVTGEASNLANHRVQVLRKNSASMNGFIKSHGLPDMTYEYRSNNRNGIMLFYVTEDVVFSFLEDTPDPDSRYLVEHRSIKDNELGVYLYLTTGHLPSYNLSASKNSI